MKTETPVAVKLQDYQPTAYSIAKTELIIRIFDHFTQVEAKLHMQHRQGAVASFPPLVLDGIEQEIKQLFINDEAVADYQYDGRCLTLDPQGSDFVVKAVTHIQPSTNKSLEGLYKSGNLYCTQCEAEGFRKITFYLDRPDVMAVFTTRIEADKALYPVLLANGNLVDQGELEDNRHFVTWYDPFKKPSYLFAAVAGNLVRHDDRFITASGRDVALQIFVEPANAHKTAFAMAALKRAMRWDEQRFGREYDLDIFMIVATDFFNLGAMENKGLNIFNSAVLLASTETSGDLRFERIEAIIAHEYFHNWSGNRVTCRDWFQLSLKEGFTVYRDAEFTADMHDRTRKRIRDVETLRTYQFPEDSGPNAHPVKPQEYIEINNFYTVTIYEKGAEVVRMLHTLLGAANFRRGTDRYFADHDGQAATTEDFIAAMEAESGADLTQFKRWYTQAGTPLVRVTADYDSDQQRLRLEFQQSCVPTPGQPEKLPFVIPIQMALLNDAGRELPIACDGDFNPETSVLTLSAATTVVTFTGLAQRPVASLFRDFSAPVRVEYELAPHEQLLLASKDPNLFNRFDATQELYLAAIQALLAGTSLQRASAVYQLVQAIIEDDLLSPALQAALLRLPPYARLVDNFSAVDPKALVAAVEQLQAFIGQEFATHWSTLTKALASVAPYHFDAAEAGRRELQATALKYWVYSGDPAAVDYGEALYRAADNQQDRLNGLQAVLASEDPLRVDALLAHYYRQWQHDGQMVESWLQLQTTAPSANYQTIRQLLEHEAFDITHPNRVRAVIEGYASNFKAFHDSAGQGYQLVAELITQIDEFNARLAARFVKCIENWRRFNRPHQELMKAALQRVLAAKALSPDVLEVAEKALAAPET